jgi:hypothetical protein
MRSFPLDVTPAAQACAQQTDLLQLEHDLGAHRHDLLVEVR